MKTHLLFFVVSILFSAGTLADTRIVGEVHKVDVENQTFTIRDPKTSQLHQIDFSEKTKIMIERKEYSDLGKLKVGEHVTYKRGKVKKKTDLIEAKIEDVDMENQRVTYVDQSTGKVKTAPFYESAKRKTSADDYDIEELRPGQRVMLEVVKR